MMVTLRGGFPHLEAVVPARLQSYMSAGRPVLAMIGCGGADIIKESNCGYVVSPGETGSMAKLIKENVLANKQAFEQMGKNGREYYMQHYRLGDCIDNLERIIGAK
jgi:glycosyltransferase involved in cell wall biosynthesis